MTRIESKPVVLCHVMDRGLTMCSGDEWEPPSDSDYPNVPRQLCPGCSLAIRRSKDWTGA